MACKYIILFTWKYKKTHKSPITVMNFAWNTSSNPQIQPVPKYHHVLYLAEIAEDNSKKRERERERVQNSRGDRERLKGSAATRLNHFIRGGDMSSTIFKTRWDLLDVIRVRFWEGCLGGVFYMEAAGFSTCVAAATGPFFSLLFTVEEINTEKKQGSTQMTLMADFYFC